MAKPDYARWDGIHQFTPSQAACLCCDLEPEVWTYSAKLYNPRPEIVAAMEATLRKEAGPVIEERRELVRAGYADHWGQHHPPRYGTKTLTHYTREALREWAERTGRLPAMPFLMTPAERETPPQPGPGMRADKERNRNALIGLLTLALMKRVSGFRQERGGRTVPNQSLVAQDLLKIAEEAGLDDMDGLSASNLEKLLSAGQKAIEERREELRKGPI